MYQAHPQRVATLLLSERHEKVMVLHGPDPLELQVEFVEKMYQLLMGGILGEIDQPLGERRATLCYRSGK